VELAESGKCTRLAIIFTEPGVSTKTELPSEKSTVISPSDTTPTDVDSLKEEVNKLPEINIFPETSSVANGLSVPMPTFPSI
jgi:hypothetical protein